jgi:hypothetical protein
VIFVEIYADEIGEKKVVTEEFSKYTQEAQNILLLAKEEALSCKDNSIEPEHLLLGLLRESEGVAASILKSFDVEFDTVREAINSSLLHEKSILLDDISLSSRSKRVIALAVDEVHLLNCVYVNIYLPANSPPTFHSSYYSFYVRTYSSFSLMK